MEEVIRRVPLFASLPSTEIQLLARSLRHSEFPAGSLLFHEGERGEHFAIIVDGEVEVVKAAGTGEERLINTLGAGDFLGEMSLLSPGGLRMASARARTQVQLLELSPDDFSRLIRSQAPLAVAMLTEMSLRLQRTETLTTRDLREKNRQLAGALATLQAAQEQLVEKEKLEQELRLARRIQERTLPKELPAIAGWRLSAFWQPARAVGGDFYDFIPFPDGSLGVIIGDVSGKGMPAALIMATTRSLLRFAALNESMERPVRPGKILAAVNDIGCQETPANMFITCLFAVLDTTRGRVLFANAGHTLPYRCTGQGISELRATGMPLGLMPGMRYDEVEAVIAEGDCLFLCTDGLVEAHNPQKEMFGAARLLERLAAYRCSAGRIDALIAHLTEFAGPGAEQEDDMTCLILERAGQGSG